jgi:hypothetical protein
MFLQEASWQMNRELFKQIARQFGSALAPRKFSFALETLKPFFATGERPF